MKSLKDIIHKQQLPKRKQKIDKVKNLARPNIDVNQQIEFAV
jgi:hypothetical protein